MELATYFKQWQASRKERRIERLTAKAADLKDEQQYDLLFLHEKGFVRAKGSGQSIKKIFVDVENLIRKKLHVVVKTGTYFVSSGGHQNMATTTEYAFTLLPCATEHLGIKAACINANRPIPGKNDQFYGVARVSDEVARFLEASKTEDSMVIQAGVWTLTDNYSRYDIIKHLISKDSHGNTWHPVTHEHCDRAKEILEKLGIPHRLWYSAVPYEKKSVEYENGSYVGEFRHGQRHGHGKYIWSDGDFYDGEWKDDKKHGNGSFTCMDGHKYIGKYEDGREVGGWYYYPDGRKLWVCRNSRGKLEQLNPPQGINSIQDIHQEKWEAHGPTLEQAILEIQRQERILIENPYPGNEPSKEFYLSRQISVMAKIFAHAVRDCGSLTHAQKLDTANEIKNMARIQEMLDGELRNSDMHDLLFLQLSILKEMARICARVLVTYSK